MSAKNFKGSKPWATENPEIQDPSIGRIFRYDPATFPKIAAEAERNQRRLKSETAERAAGKKG